MSDQGSRCGWCDARYRVDLVLPDALWAEVITTTKPSGEGLLCGMCIMSTLETIARAKNGFGYLVVHEGDVT